MKNNAIRVVGLTKEYQLGVLGSGTLQSAWQHVWAKVRKKEETPLKQKQAALEGKHFLALDNVSFDVPRGEAIGIIGGNGAGKSTLLKILSGITTPTSGFVEISGRAASLLEVGTGFHPEMTGRENVYLNGAILGMSKEEIDGKLDSIMAFSEIGEFIDTPVKRYSSGMYVRLAFAVAAHLEPEILIVDEVLAVGDARFQQKCLGKMSEVSGADGKTVLFVSHNLNAIETLCKNSIWLEKGRLVKSGPSKTVIAEYMGDYRVQTSFEAIWPDLDKAPRNKNVVVERVFIVGRDGEKVEHLSCDDPFFIHIDYKVIEPAAEIGFAIKLFTKSGELGFTSLSTATNSDDKNIQPLGNYRATCIIPRQLINTGDFFIGLGIYSDGFHNRVDYGRVLEFSIESGVESERLYRMPVYGILRPRLEWSSQSR